IMLSGDPFNPELASPCLLSLLFPMSKPFRFYFAFHFPFSIFPILSSLRLSAPARGSFLPNFYFPFSIFHSRDDAEFLPQLHRLGAALSAQFVKHAAGVRLYSVFAHEELFGDLPVAQTLRDQPQYFQFARRDAQGFTFAVVSVKGFAG